eukprot:3198101-Rhodomonas_salina.1
MSGVQRVACMVAHVWRALVLRCNPSLSLTRLHVLRSVMHVPTRAVLCLARAHTNCTLPATLTH